MSGMHGSFSGQQMETEVIDYLLVEKTLGALPLYSRNKTQPAHTGDPPPHPLSFTTVSGYPLSLGQVVISSSICAQAYPGMLRACCWQRWVMVLVSRGRPRPGSCRGAERSKNLLGFYKTVISVPLCYLSGFEGDCSSQSGFNPAKPHSKITV